MNPDLRATHDALQRIVDLAQTARQELAQEREGPFTEAVLELGQLSEKLVDLVLAW